MLSLNVLICIFHILLEKSIHFIGKSTNFSRQHRLLLNTPRGVTLKSFPSPLTEAEEKYYLQQYSAGDPEAKTILIEHNLRLVAHIIKKYQYLEESQEDLISIGTIGLIKAINTFKQEKKNRLGTYAARCIENEILMMLRTKKKIAKEVSIYEPVGTDRDGNEIQLFDIIENEDSDAHTQIVLKDDIQLLYEKIESELTYREQTVLKMRYGLYGDEVHTQREVADLLHISRSYISRIEKSAILKLRPFFLTLSS